MTYEDTIATRYQHTLRFNSLDRNRPFDAKENLRVCLNRIQTLRIAVSKSLIIIQAPRITEKQDHLSTITFLTKEDLTPAEQSLIRMEVSPRKALFNVAVGEKAPVEK